MSGRFGGGLQGIVTHHRGAVFGHQRCCPAAVAVCDDEACLQSHSSYVLHRHCRISGVGHSQVQHGTATMHHLQRRALLPYPDLPGSTHSSGCHSLQALCAAEVSSRQLEHAAQQSTRASLCFSAPWQCCSPEPMQHSSPAHGSSTCRPVPRGCTMLRKQHHSQPAHVVQLRLPLRGGAVGLVGQLAQAAKGRGGGEPVLQVGLLHVRLQCNTMACQSRCCGASRVQAKAAVGSY